MYFNGVGQHTYVLAEMSAGKRKKSDSEVLGIKKFFNSAKDTSSNSGGLSENSKKALSLLKNRHGTPRGCVQTKPYFFVKKATRYCLNTSQMALNLPPKMEETHL